MATIYTGLGGPMGYGEGSFRGSPLTSGNYDDGSIRVNIGSVFDEGGIDFFGTKYESIYINTNGLITFASAQTSYTPTSLAALNFPAIAAFWSDVNISSGSATGNNNIYWDLDPANDTVTITWLAVRPYSGTGSNTFQVQLTHTGDGNFEIEFLYQQIQWTNGFSGVAQTGFTDGGTIDYVLPGSGNTAALQQYPTTPLSPGDPNGIWTQHFWNGTPVCFTEGTLISTPSGPCAVENLRVGDLVDTLDDGPQPLRWVGGWRMLAAGDRLPICIDAGALGNRHALRVSGQHLLLVSGADCELLFGEPEVLVAAKDLVGLPGITADTKPCPWCITIFCWTGIRCFWPMARLPKACIRGRWLLTIYPRHFWRRCNPAFSRQSCSALRPNLPPAVSCAAAKPRSCAMHGFARRRVCAGLSCSTLRPDQAPNRHSVICTRVSPAVRSIEGKPALFGASGQPWVSMATPSKALWPGRTAWRPS